MEATDGDSFTLKDDHNHNYRSSRSSKVSLDSRAVPQAVCGPVLMGEEPEIQRGKVWTVDLEKSDSSSDSSEASETDCTALTATAEGKFTLDSTPKLRKLVHTMSCCLTTPACCHVSLVWVDGLSHISLHKPDVSAAFPTQF